MEYRMSGIASEVGNASEMQVKLVLESKSWKLKSFRWKKWLKLESFFWSWKITNQVGKIRATIVTKNENFLAQLEIFQLRPKDFQPGLNLSTKKTDFRNILIVLKNSKIWHLFSIKFEFSAKNENVLLKEGVPFWHFYLVSLLKCCYASLSLPFQPFQAFFESFFVWNSSKDSVHAKQCHKQYYLERLTTGQILFWRSSA